MKKCAAKSSERQYKKGWSVRSFGHFNFFGLYYRVQAGNHIFPCRSVLDIIHNDICKQPSVDDPYDLLVIMMNPGSSLTSEEKSSGFTLRDWMISPHQSMTGGESKQHGPLITDRSEISRLESWQSVSKPDDVQGAICQVLLNTGIKRARVLNLIDIRYPTSGVVPKIYRLAKRSGFDECSVFAPGRAEDLKRLIKPLGEKCDDLKGCGPHPEQEGSSPSKKKSEVPPQPADPPEERSPQEVAQYDNQTRQKARVAVIAHGSLKALDDLAKDARKTLEDNGITLLSQEKKGKSSGQWMHPGRKSPKQWVEPITNQLLCFMAACRG